MIGARPAATWRRRARTGASASPRTPDRLTPQPARTISVDRAGQVDVLAGDAAGRVGGEGEGQRPPADVDVRVVVGRLGRLGDPVDHGDRGREAGQLGGPGDPVRTAAPPVELRQRGVDRSLIQELAHELHPTTPTPGPAHNPAPRRGWARRRSGGVRAGGRVAGCGWWWARCCGTRAAGCWRRGGSGRPAGSCRAARSSRARPSRPRWSASCARSSASRSRSASGIGPDVPIGPDLLLRAWTAVAHRRRAHRPRARRAALAGRATSSTPSPWLPADRPVIAALTAPPVMTAGPTARSSSRRYRRRRR